MSPLFSSGTHLLHADFPDGLSHVYTAGDVVQGNVNLTLGSQKQGQLKIDSVVAKLRVVQVSTYYRHRSDNHTDRRTETIKLYSEDRTLFEARGHPLPDPSLPPPTIQLPFSFRLPPIELGLPPSFEGGSRSGSALGHEVGRIIYFIKITGHKLATFSVDERLTLPFIYMQPSLVHPLSLPPPLVFRPMSEKQTLSAYPPPQPVQGYQTMVVEKEYRESLFGKKSRLVLKARLQRVSFPISQFVILHQLTLKRLDLSQLTLPTLPALPRNTTIPYHLKLTLLAPPTSSASTPPQLNLPSLSALQILLVRSVFTQARGASQTFHQTVGTLTDLKTEPRIWYAPHGWREERGEKRWGGEVTVVGEMMVGGAAGPSFGGGSTRGLLSCEYHIRLKLPLKGPLSSLDVNPFLPLVITSDLYPGFQQRQRQLGQEDLPPGYLEVDAKFAEGEGKQRG